MNEEQAKKSGRQWWRICVEPVSFWFHVVQVDIPEEQGNVVVLYEVC